MRTDEKRCEKALKTVTEASTLMPLSLGFSESSLSSYDNFPNIINDRMHDAAGDNVPH